jgi:uncharacterized protein (TIGR03086 family)
MMDIFVAFDVAQGQFEQTLRGVGDDQWHLPTPCSEWNVYQVANHVVAAGDYFMALLSGASKDDALQQLLAPDVLQPDPVAAFVAQRPLLRASFAEPGAMDRIGHHVIADMTGAQLLHGCVAETTVHAWDIANATGDEQPFDPQLAELVLATYHQLSPIFVANGFAAPAVVIGADEPVQAQLIALSGRRPLPTPASSSPTVPG